MNTIQEYFPEIVKEIFEENETETAKSYLKDFWKICTLHDTTMYAKPYVSNDTIIGIEYYFIDDHTNSLRDCFGGIYPAKTMRTKKCTFEEFLDNNNVSKAHFYLYAH